MRFLDALEQAPLILTEGSLVERIRRDPSVELDPHAAHAGFVLEERGRAALDALYRSYLDVGRSFGFPMMVGTPTWRAGPERLALAGLPGIEEVNAAGFRFLDAVRKDYGDYAGKILVCGLMGCRGDAYRPEESLPEREARAFHRPQARALSAAGAELLMAATLPALPEALGMARAMAEQDRPYLLSFVITAEGTLLDRAPLREAVTAVDQAVRPRPAGYLVNCVHPAVLDGALRGEPRLHGCGRLLGLQANTSRKPPAELDALPDLDTEEPEAFAEIMATLHRRYGLKILGGCCGTDREHILALAKTFSEGTGH